MTARAESVMPVSPDSRKHLAEHRSELIDLSLALTTTRDELRADALLGVPVEADVLRLVRDAADLLLIAARRLNPDQETRS